MSSVLVVAEIHQGTIKKATYTAVTFARQAAQRTGGQVHILAIGSNIGAPARELAAFAPVVHAADHADLQNPLAEAYAQVIAQAAKASGATVVAMAATAAGKDILPRAAALLGAGMASEVMGFVGPSGLQLTRPIQAGNVIAAVEITTPIKVISTRSTEFSPAQPLPGAGEVKALAVQLTALKTRYVRLDAVQSTRPALSDARVVVSGGRGLKEGDNFRKYIEPLADKLNAAVGASRAIVDAGWVPNDLQVGQTGKVVAPDLYIAVGISGAIQHVAGMKGSKTIVAINKDPEAPIFQVADYGLVADLFKAVPELLEKL
ncbi:MAG: electron transfer flavoprotein subunit alpha/FixB family protein [Deltaproteobacteria bacterium]|nr:electron transfer flavoprotein subunit alpha/FixB family protein [Deltaproteobacteria bacterium]